MSGFLGAPANALAPAPDLGGVLGKRYVRTAGDNANDGLSPATAWATLAFARTQLPDRYRNGGYVIDITGIDETLTHPIQLPDADPLFYAFDPAILFSGVAAAFTIHSDLVTFLTIAVVDIVSVIADAVTGQQVITTAGLTPNELIGKIVSQGGLVVGVVKSNTATQIRVTATFLSAVAQIVISDPGATLRELTVSGGSATGFGYITALGFPVTIEGISLKSAISYGLSIIGGDGSLAIQACEVDTIIAVNGLGGDLWNCYVKPSDAPNDNCFGFNKAVSFWSFFKGISIFSDNSIVGFVDFSNCALESCGALFRIANTAIFGASFGSMNGKCSQVEFLTPTSNAVDILGPGDFLLNDCTINGAAASPIKASGPCQLTLRNIPAGAGNVSIGVTLAKGARCEADSTVALTASLGDVSIGGTVSTWVAVTAAPGNRINALTANLITGVVTGDGSSAHRTP